MRQVWTLALVALVWAQEESRARENLPTAPKPAPATRAVTPKREVVVMETISGKVVDKSGEGLKGLRIWIVDKETGQVLGETRTGEKGSFALAIPSAESLVVRMSREGKEFFEREYTMEEFTTGEPEIVFAP